MHGAHAHKSSKSFFTIHFYRESSLLLLPTKLFYITDISQITHLKLYIYEGASGPVLNFSWFSTSIASSTNIQFPHATQSNLISSRFGCKFMCGIQGNRMIIMSGFILFMGCHFHYNVNNLPYFLKSDQPFKKKKIVNIGV